MAGGGSGQVTVTVDTRGDPPFGRYTGRIWASVAGEVVAATPISVEVEPQRYSLTLRHLGEAGALVPQDRDLSRISIALGTVEVGTLADLVCLGYPGGEVVVELVEVIDAELVQLSLMPIIVPVGYDIPRLNFSSDAAPMSAPVAHVNLDDLVCSRRTSRTLD